MIDRAARRETARLLRDYMDERITAHGLDEGIADAAAGTDDEALREARDRLWFCYDDLKDHPVVASRDEWAFFERLARKAPSSMPGERRLAGPLQREKRGAGPARRRFRGTGGSGML